MDIIDRVERVQSWSEEWFRRWGKGKYGRVLKMARRPDSKQFTKTIQVAGAGLVLMGALGFSIYWMMVQAPPFLMKWWGGK